MREAAQWMWVRRLVWVYFALLLGEGALRKWVAPSLSNPLLLVRDPVAIAIYVLAFRLRLFPRNSFILTASWLSLLCLVAGLITLGGAYAAALYGWRSDFLHLPLIFVIARVWCVDDVREVGRWTLLLAAPMALLMALQFRAGSDSWLNAGAGEGAGQITSALGRVRPAGTFSFVSGPVLFFSMVAAFLFWSQLDRRTYKLWLVILGASSLVIAAAVSGSRSLLGGCAVVALFASGCALLLRPYLLFRWVWAGALMLVVALTLQQLDIVREGMEVLTARIADASGTEGATGGVIGRMISGYTVAIPILLDAPLLGHGLGMGTNVGAKLISGKVQFLLAEGEWARVLLESGPILGSAFLLWRIALTIWLGARAASSAAKANTLPFLLFSTCALNIFSGQWSQATTLGFTIFCAGLALAALNQPHPRATRTPEAAPQAQPHVAEHAFVSAVAGSAP